jgi:hypothetical protein
MSAASCGLSRALLSVFLLALDRTLASESLMKLDGNKERWGFSYELLRFNANRCFLQIRP